MPEPTQQQITLYGYSERGMVNSICDDILRSVPPMGAVMRLLGACKFPFQPAGTPDFSRITSAVLLVEQGFSDFGDLDLLLLLDDPTTGKHAVMLEAKVRTDTARPKKIRDQWQGFALYLGGDTKQRSSLFVQLYRKMRLIRQVQNLAVPLPGDAVALKWRLGANRVVLKAAELLAEYRANPWYVALVPDTAASVADFYKNTLRPFVPQANLPEWTPENIERWGYLTWPDLDALCRSDQATWSRTVSNFDWNTHQIFEVPADSATVNNLAVTVGQVYRLRDDLVFVVIARAGEVNCRVVAATHPGDYFPTTTAVPKRLLQPTQDVPPVSITDLRPKRDGEYDWNPPANENANPERTITVPQAPQRVRILVQGWETSKVRVVSGGAPGQEFKVFNRHLRRA